MTTPSSGAPSNAPDSLSSPSSQASAPGTARPSDPKDDALDSDAFQAWARRASELAAVRRGRRGVPSIIRQMAALHDELLSLRCAPGATATPDELATLGAAITALNSHLLRLINEFDRTPEHKPPELHRIPFFWQGSRYPIRDALERWGSDGPAQFGRLSLDARAEVLEGTETAADVEVPAVDPFPARWSTRWRLGVDPVSAPAVVETLAHLSGRATRTARILDEITKWLPIVASTASVIAQHHEGSLHRRDAIAELERWLWRKEGAQWTIHTDFKPREAPSKLGGSTIEYDEVATIAPEAYRALEQLREHLGQWPREIRGVPAEVHLLPGFGSRSNWKYKAGEVVTRVTHSVIVHGQVGELAFKWLVDLIPPRAPIVERPRERPEVVLVLRNGAVARVVTNISRLLVRVVDPEGPEGSEDTWVTLPGDAHPVWIQRRAPEYDPAFVDVVRTHAPRRPAR